MAPTVENASFENASEGIRATGASSDTRAMVELLERHGAEEGELLAVYEDLASNASDEGARYLISLILDDERRHHRLLVEMANAMAWGNPSRSPERATPALSTRVDGELLEMTRRLRRAEEADYRKLRRLRRRMHPFRETTLWDLLVQLMMLDTKKHAAMLRFLERREPKR
jgi:rubrerythrin